MGSSRLAGPAALSTAAATVYTATAQTVVQRGRVSNPTGSPLTFTMSIGADAAGTRIYSSTVVPPNAGYDIYGPFSLNPGDIIQAFGSSTSLVLELSGTTTVLVSYFTTFAGTENPISEGGAWHASGLGLNLIDIGQPALPASQTPVVTSGGHAFGVSSVTSPSGLDDSRSLLSGFPPDHLVTATLAVNSLTGTFTEVELHLRFDDSGTYARGYECLLSGYGQYCGVVRWNGDGSFTGLCTTGNMPHAPANGDTYSAQIVGNIITIKLAGVTQLIYDVSTAAGTPLIFSITGTPPTSDGNGSSLIFSTGNPGMGFDTNGSDSAFALADYLAQGLS